MEAHTCEVKGELANQLRTPVLRTLQNDLNLKALF